ncbi:MAG: TonB C-terminal domain-containing protein [Thermodesulfobacteriota bacterium]|nr:TonB C-terminal domain-containing protein [Thermodesulfobacteriota bacterium]
MNNTLAFVSISAICHCGLLWFFLGAGVSSSMPAMDRVYEVSLVSRPASVSGHTPGQTQGRYAKVRKYIRREGESQARPLSGITRETLQKSKAPHLSPSRIEPAKPAEPAASVGPGAYKASHGVQGKGAGFGAGAAEVWIAEVRNVVLSRFKVPPEVNTFDKVLKTTYYLRISRQGILKEKKLMVSSGNRLFDMSVFLALQGVQRFPPPPASIMAGRQIRGFTMSFSPPK